ncbi:sulfotransferase domain-containing protein [Candidatus Poribacteria bacterium]|nr:sulfotransferase domain-containing protein [Candidatus Poribacteria bacterium]
MKSITKSVKDYQYLIVGGTTKAATTSLYSYLSDHPSICAASYKETRFFLDIEYPLPSKFRFNGDIEEYNSLFTQCKEGEIRMESTPDYLYCSSALDRIATYLPKSKLVFSLREPISRIISWYRFGKQIDRLPKSLSIDDYIENMFAIDSPSQNSNNMNKGTVPIEDTITQQYMQTLQQGCYSTYLKKYLEQIDRNRIHILYYEQIAEEPLKELMDICNFVGIDPKFYTDYTFEVTNRTETMRNSSFHKQYRNLRFKMRGWTHNKPIIHKPLKIVRKAIEPIYLKMNTRPQENINISKKTKDRLINYYRDDVHSLTELTGKQPPWLLYT